MAEFRVLAITWTVLTSVSSSECRAGWSVTVAVLTAWRSTPPISARAFRRPRSRIPTVPLEASSATADVVSLPSSAATKKTTAPTAVTSATAPVSSNCQGPWPVTRNLLRGGVFSPLHSVPFFPFVFSPFLPFLPSFPRLELAP